ncbi:MAG: 3-dehydroquinate synthase [Kiritimatiellae bacterium]|nr:3-dehydroquinate synthase [Kiritimatiellia bacterium]
MCAMTNIRINASTRYDVSVGSGASEQAADFIRTALPRVNKVAVVTDSNVDVLHSSAVVSRLADAGLAPVKFAFPAGEKSKNLATYASLIDFLAENRLDRTDIVLALGGGVTGDMAGFAAATYKRGIDFIQMPTTLLAMVDSSVGGKTAVDIAAGKNLVGAFHQPRAVFCDLRFLDTLPDGWRMDGMGEVLKYAVLRDQSLFGKLESAPLAPIGESEIAACIGMKRDIVEADEKESGMRKLLNLGHTFAHAIEKLSGFGISHGRAVATGIAMASRAAAKRGALSGEDCVRIESLVSAMGYDVHVKFAATEIADAMMDDKKVEGESIDLVIPHGIGHCAVCRMPLAEVGKVVADAV